MMRNFRGMLSKKDYEQVVFHQCQDFDVLEKIRLRPKSQSQSNSQDGFAEQNEPTLQDIPGDIVTTKDP